MTSPFDPPSFIYGPDCSRKHFGEALESRDCDKRQDFLGVQHYSNLVPDLPAWPSRTVCIAHVS